MLSTKAGQLAEEKVAEYLESTGYQVLDKNWRTRTCEIDIVAYKNRTVFFVEVKYRSTSFQGTGFEYITPAKLRRMKYAARLWTAKHNWTGSYCLCAASVHGSDLVVDFIEQV